MIVEVQFEFSYGGANIYLCVIVPCSCDGGLVHVPFFSTFSSKEALFLYSEVVLFDWDLFWTLR